MPDRCTRIAALKAAAAQRIIVLDGPKGTEIQGKGLTEADFRGSRFAGHDRGLKGNNDILNLTRPDVIEAIHRDYAEAGAEIISTNSFNANAISQGEYGLAEESYAINKAAAEVARAKGITRVVFDRSGARFHGKVKALADAAREAGLEF